jgi:hypothetical protein
MLLDLDDKQLSVYRAIEGQIAVRATLSVPWQHPGVAAQQRARF